jgi:hypothetical protein
MMNSSRNQNMDSWKSGNRYDALRSVDDQENMKASTGKKSMSKLDVPIKTYKDEIHHKCQNDHRHSQRSEAYNALSNKTELGNNLAKTRMCDSVEKKETCRHGRGCRFAHSLEELVMRACFFKDECRFVRFERNKLVNNGRDICRNKHPHETENEFLERVGLCHYKTTHVPTHVPTPKVITHEKSMHTCDRHTTSSWATKLMASLKPSSPLLEEVLLPFEEKQVSASPPSFEKQVLPAKEVVLRVPKELVMQALELAIKSGNTCIRVEVVD